MASTCARSTSRFFGYHWYVLRPLRNSLQSANALKRARSRQGRIVGHIRQPSDGSRITRGRGGEGSQASDAERWLGRPRSAR